jgi:hypothetical protein
MSISIPLKSLDDEWKSYIKKECNIWEEITKYNPVPKCFTIFKVDKTKIPYKAILPIGIWKDLYDDFPNKTNYHPISSDKKFEGELRETLDQDQKTLTKEAIEHLNKNHSILLALRTGFGKTVSTVYLISHFKLKAVILCHATTLHPQWVREFRIHASKIKVQVIGNISSKEDFKLDEDYDVYILGVIKCTHLNRDVFDKIGVIVVDEAHLCMTETFSDALLNFSPRYLIGLSATPDRKDGMDRLLYPFFGYPETFIKRSQKKNFKVIKYITNFKPIIKQNYLKSLDWNSVVNSIAYNNERQRFIVKLCQEYSKDKILILSNRVCECIGCKNNSNCKCLEKKSIGIVPLLKEVGESVDARVGSSSRHNEDSRIVVGTFQKLSVGYDSKRTLLILVSDISDVRQAEGRIRVDNNIVIDLVDKFKPFENHYQERERWYLERGATIEVKERKDGVSKEIETKSNLLKDFKFED